MGKTLCRKETPSHRKSGNRKLPPTGKVKIGNFLHRKVEIGNSLHRKGGNRQLPPQERWST